MGYIVQNPTNEFGLGSKRTSADKSSLGPQKTMHISKRPRIGSLAVQLIDSKLGPN